VPPWQEEAEAVLRMPGFVRWALEDSLEVKQWVFTHTGYIPSVHWCASWLQFRQISKSVEHVKV
jgi:hypothetical protein